ncbi:MAG: cation:proton antiporter [Burkholderiales bacterium]|nr:cation:proton antiporter [Burkholderiales bacterium]
MDTPTLMIGISAAVLLSYWFNHLGRVLRFPSVVFLLLTGLLLRAATDARGLSVQPPAALLSVLGTLGLILIVLEGALDLDLVAGRRGFLQRTFASAALGVVGGTAVLAAVLKLLFAISWPAAVMVAIPFGVISSAAAIPGAEVLPKEEREFVIYESSWSDILGVMLFNAATVALAAGGGGFTLNLFGGAAAVLLIGGVLGLGMVWLVGNLEGHVKFLPLIFGLVLVYAAAEVMNLSPLLIVLVLGLMLNNPHLLRRVKGLARLQSRHYPAELLRLKHLTAEATFLVRTFFFLLLGYSTDLGTLADPRAWGVALLIVVCVFGLRWPLLWLFNGRRPRPLLWAAPRGLITVVLFYSLPPALLPAALPHGALILVVLLSCIVMALGLRRDGAQAGDEAGAPAPEAPAPAASTTAPESAS